MILNASRAFPAWAMPALLALLLAAPLTARASEGNAVSSHAPIAAPARTQAAAPVVVPAPVPTLAAARPSSAPTPIAPTPIAAGPVWVEADGAWRQAGIASWYGGRRWQGRRTASGTRYDERQLTAAHASLPLGSQVRVTVVNTGRTVVVTINDRPGTRTRIIDLSRAAAVELGILARGLAQVTLTPT